MSPVRKAVLTGLGLACLFYLLFTAWATWQQLYEMSDARRLFNIAVIIALGWVGGECMGRGLRRR